MKSHYRQLDCNDEKSSQFYLSENEIYEQMAREKKSPMTDDLWLRYERFYDGLNGILLISILSGES